MLPDVLAMDLKIVFCGTAVGHKSAQASAYYAGPGNKFWKTLHKIGLTPRMLEPREYRLLPQFGIGLTDLVKAKSGQDSELSPGDFLITDLEYKIERYAPRFLAFNGKRAAQEFLGIKRVEYGPVNRTVRQTDLFVLPSTSGAANGFWNEDHWMGLAQACGRS